MIKVNETYKEREKLGPHFIGLRHVTCLQRLKCFLLRKNVEHIKALEIEDGRITNQVNIEKRFVNHYKMVFQSCGINRGKKGGHVDLY